MFASTVTVLTLSATLLLATIVSSSDECYRNRRITVKTVAHFENCNQYVVCVGRIRMVRNCPEESGWSELEQTCVPGEAERCRKKPKLRLMSVGVTEVEPSISCVASSDSCPARFDPFALVLRAHEDCAKYYLCISFLPVVLSCPANLRFNERTCQCDFPENVDCGMTTTTDLPEGTDTTTEEPEGTDTTTEEPEGTDTTTSEPEGTDTTTSEPEETTSTATPPTTSSPAPVTVTLKPETPETTTVPASTTTTEKPPVVVEIMEAVNKVFEVVDALKKIWYDYIWKK
ncbi:hypothetical protein pipiens_008554 [Culex pipiens pipiens]|uniref:Chitin-binding type-2 domain-containing protein n=1 Tax=Culex pipiens pipiens TaxID=38569 RepID=A0ABD1DJ25_CULPP